MEQYIYYMIYLWGHVIVATQNTFLESGLIIQQKKNIPAKPLHKHVIDSIHFNNFPCMRICDKLSRHLFMLT